MLIQFSQSNSTTKIHPKRGGNAFLLYKKLTNYTLNKIGNEWEPMDLTQSQNHVCLQIWSAISIKQSSADKWDGDVASTLARRPPFPPWKIHHPMRSGQVYTSEILEICVSFLWEI